MTAILWAEFGLTTALIGVLIGKLGYLRTGGRLGRTIGRSAMAAAPLFMGAALTPSDRTIVAILTSIGTVLGWIGCISVLLEVRENRTASVVA